MDASSEIGAIDGARRGEERAWRRLFEWHLDAVYQFCLTLAGGREDLAEETAQQVFMTAAGQIRRFSSERGTFRAWLLGIARNRYRSLELKEQRRRRHEAQSAGNRPKQDRSRETELWVHEVLARLPLTYRSVLEAKYLDGSTTKAIAEDKGATVEAVESLLRRARGKFAQLYEQMQDLR